VLGVRGLARDQETTLGSRMGNSREHLHRDAGQRGDFGQVAHLASHDLG